MSIHLIFQFSIFQRQNNSTSVTTCNKIALQTWKIAFSKYARNTMLWSNGYDPKNLLFDGLLSTKKKRHYNFILKFNSIQISQKYITHHSPYDFKSHQNYITLHSLTAYRYHQKISLITQRLTLNLTKTISLLTHRLTCCGIHRKIRSVQGFHWDFLKIVSFFMISMGSQWVKKDVI